MSSFLGKMENYKCLSIDRFDGNNLSSSAFFLSHCHTDHMVGLNSDGFKSKLRNEKSTKLFTSEVTKCLLLADEKYTFLAPHIEALPLEVPKMLQMNSSHPDMEFTVTLMPAGHCPGSVMFLFEGCEGTSLYTGDFRLPKGAAARMKFLKYDGHLKEIEHAYVDTTFCTMDAWYIPEREKCLKALNNLVKEWIGKGREYVVRLNMSAKYGYEYLFQELYRSFRGKIYCSRAENYACIPDVADVLTTDPSNSQIFACFKTEKVNAADWSQWQGNEDDNKIKNLKYLTVTLSTMYFTTSEEADVVEVQTGANHYRLCFSFHSSLSEVCDFLTYIKPRHIHANVIPNSTETFKSVEKRLRRLCCLDNTNKEQPFNYKPLGSIRRPENGRNKTVPVVQKKKFSSFDESDSNKEMNFVKRRKCKTIK